MDSVTAEKYKAIRRQQQLEIEDGVGLIDDDSLPLLPEWQKQLEALQKVQEEDANAAKAAESSETEGAAEEL